MLTTNKVKWLPLGVLICTTALLTEYMLGCQMHNLQTSRPVIVRPWLEGPLITLRANNVPVQDIIQQVCTQSGVTPQFIGLSPRFGHPLTLHARNKQFWKVLRSIAIRSGVSPSRMGVGPGRRLEFNAGSWFGLTPIDIHGAFAVIIPSISRTTDEHYNVSSVGRGKAPLHIPMVLLWCSKRREFLSAANPVLLRAIDDRGNALVVPKTQAADATGSYGGKIFHYKAILRAPSGENRYISILRGIIPLTIAVAPQSYTVNGFGSDTSTVNAAGIRLALGKPEYLHGLWYVPLQIHTDMPPVVQMFTSTLFDGGCITFLDAKGRKLQRLGISNAYGYKYFRCELEVDGGKPATARVRIYTRILHYNLPFVFRNLPLPN